NTGISASIDSNGRRKAMITQHGATMVPGTMLLGAVDTGDEAPTQEPKYQIGPRVLVDSRKSMYSTVGDMFAWILVVAAAALAAMSKPRRRVNMKG
ncbi:MAG: hypothetical protein QGG25_17120, partial [Phycisphaerae bacterium]|nr:hypothetical protein [Phycisphaerae bacterium]